MLLRSCNYFAIPACFQCMSVRWYVAFPLPFTLRFALHHFMEPVGRAESPHLLAQCWHWKTTLSSFCFFWYSKNALTFDWNALSVKQLQNWKSWELLLVNVGFNLPTQSYTAGSCFLLLLRAYLIFNCVFTSPCSYLHPLSIGMLGHCRALYPYLIGKYQRVLTALPLLAKCGLLRFRLSSAVKDVHCDNTQWDDVAILFSSKLRMESTCIRTSSSRSIYLDSVGRLIMYQNPW